MRFFLDISYNGTAYHGWQRQENAHTVQEEIENGLSTILRTKIAIMGSGRTDTGVHAKKQIAHFDHELGLSTQQLVYKLNGILPPDIAINACHRVKDDAHARFSAEKRGYLYYVHQKKSPFLNDLSYFHPHELDVEAMNKAAELFLGEKDFKSFSRVKTEVDHFRCTVHQAIWYQVNEQWVFKVEANRFLRGMVRAMVGTLLLVGRKKLTEADVVSILEQQDRTKAGSAAPPQALYLNRVDYPQDIYL